ncbi:hypothetical protein KR018_010136 [Drosophila ironensis]|nr:hypothetical protein KR018_010136 [Drosophila ironensis]
MTLALRVARISAGPVTRWPQDRSQLLQLCRPSDCAARAPYSTDNRSSTKASAEKPQLRRNVAAEITSVGKMIYETGWDATKPPSLSSSTSSCCPPDKQSDKPEEKKPDKEVAATEAPKTKREQMRDNMQEYIFTRYFNYVKNYDKVLEKNFPKAVHLYRVFFDGVKDFFGDMKRFLKITRIANESSQGILALNRQELELYMQMPRDMLKVAPALLGCSLPMVGYAFFPLVFWYPRTFLTSHFWTPQQRVEFQCYYIKRRLGYNKPVLRYLQSRLKATRAHPMHAQMEEILGQLGSGTHPTPEMLIEVKDIFAQGPYSLLDMSRKHVKNLVNLHGLSNSIFKRHRLHEHAFLVHYMDQAIMREGGVHNLPLGPLRYACYLRGLNPDGLGNEEMIGWLRKWVKVSTSIKSEHISLFLHLPILLGYNHPGNWRTIYGKAV